MTARKPDSRPGAVVCKKELYNTKYIELYLLL
jgi:hypothetical protein